MSNKLDTAIYNIMTNYLLLHNKTTKHPCTVVTIHVTNNGNALKYKHELNLLVFNHLCYLLDVFVFLL